MPRPRSPRRHSRSPRRQRDRQRSLTPRSLSRSRSRSRGRARSPVRRYSRDSPPPKVRRESRRSLTPELKQTKYGGRRSRSYTPENCGHQRSPSPYQEQRVSGRNSPRNYRDQSPDYYQKPKDSQMPTYVVMNRDRSFSPDRRPGQSRQQYDDRRDEPRDLDARLREIEARSPEITKPRTYEKGEYSRSSPKDSYRASASYEKSRLADVGDYRRDDKSPDRYQEDKYQRNTRDFDEPSRKDSYNDDYQASGRAYSPPRRGSHDQRNGASSERRHAKDAKYKHSPDRYRSPERDGRSYKDEARQDRSDRDRRNSDKVVRGQRDEDKYPEKKERSGRDRSSHSNRGSTSRDGHDSRKSHRSSTDKSRQDKDREEDFDPTLVIVPRRKDEGRGGIFNRPEITMRPITDDPDNQSAVLEEKRVVAVMPGKQLPGPTVSERDIHRDYLELLARKDFEVRKDKLRDIGLGSPQTLSSRFQGSSSLDLLATLENFEINRSKLERELELRREMEILRERSPLRLAGLPDLEDRLSVMERKVEPKNPRDLRYDLESRRKQLKAGRVEVGVPPRRAVTKKTEKDTKLRMTSADHRRPVRERLGLSPGKRERRDRREVEERIELPDFKKEVEELQKAQWIEDPKSVPKGPGYFEHDDREDAETFGSPTRGRGGFRGRGRGLGFRGRGGNFQRGRGFFRGNFRARGGFRGVGRGGRGTFRGRSSPQWKHDKFEDGKEKKNDRKDDRSAAGSSASKAKSSSNKRESTTSHGSSSRRSDSRHTSSRRDDSRKSAKDSRDRRTERSRDTSGSRARDSRDSRKDRR